MIKTVAFIDESEGPILANFSIGDKAKIDDGDVRGTITGIYVLQSGVQYHFSWWNNGSLTEQWIDEFRLSKEVAQF